MGHNCKSVLNSNYGNFYIVILSQPRAIPVGFLWKLEITVVDTTTIAARFNVPYRATAGAQEVVRSAWAPFREHFAFLLAKLIT